MKYTMQNVKEEIVLDGEELLNCLTDDGKKFILEILSKNYGADYRYWEDQETKDRYFYTLHKVNHQGKLRYVAGIYRYLKTKKALKLVKTVGFSKKRKAIERAYRWFKERK